ncbi:MAG: N-acetylmuramoyl-L-alanine amidase [Bacteroides sp.]|nr:N-acetylmuramoyl-L-alanine amidase [Bacteroides sp.]
MTGYHYYIRRDGNTVCTRPPKLVGAHVKGYNKHSIGICYEGGLDVQGRPKDTRTPEQRSALRLLVAQLLHRFKDNIRVCGHRDLSPDLNGNGTVEAWEWTKQCPCFEVSSDL